jgi:hypothetical protein
MAVERRSCPRYQLSCDVLVLLPIGGNHHAETTHLSRNSIQLVCNAELVIDLLKQQRLPYLCKLEFTLPWYRRRFAIEAQLITQRRMSQQQYSLALLLRHQDQEQANLLAALLEQNVEAESD